MKVPSNYAHFHRYLVQPILRISQDNAEELKKQTQAGANEVGVVSWSTVGDHCTFSGLVSVDYGEKHYVIGDLIDSVGLPVVNDLRDAYLDKNGRQLGNLLSSNKDVFGLISDLYSDINIDAKNLPVQQLIQVQ
ncbi:MAG: hypothetical protein LV480_11360 [Methylacidiphilales bacterium]|nr:hypothetical protein [Candidatus Methylacidiphilales bacterium]